MINALRNAGQCVATFVVPLFITSQLILAASTNIPWYAGLLLLKISNEPTQPPLLEYQKVAENLVKNKYYTGLLEAIDDCAKNPGYFIVLDCPSGSGKTLAGVALREVERVGSNRLRVVHVVWNDAVHMQKIYGQILEDQHAQQLRAESFFYEAKVFLETYASEISNLQATTRVNTLHKLVWEHFLQLLFTEEKAAVFDLKQFELKHGLHGKILTIFLDETPTKFEDVRMIGRLRDILKTIRNVVLILAGTHAKAANMIGLSQGSVSSSDLDDLDPWAIVVTRLPKFSLSHSGLARSWRVIKRDINKFADTTVKHVVSCIQSSMDNGGNPRLIIWAVRAMTDAPANFSFHSWQKKILGQTGANEVLCARILVWWFGGARRAAEPIDGSVSKCKAS
mmetsp:Transcript_2667/g.5668  ORF Transcript_2667/g.5668 Transcript_2667/m.5668 type:complete len:395 (+) Transcript_2667:143-1327(+)